MLIRDGALLVRNAQDIISILGDNRASPQVVEDEQMPLHLAESTKSKRSLLETSKLHQRILDQLGPSP